MAHNNNPSLTVHMHYQSAVMNELECNIDKVASVDVSILLLGETGTGKELTARKIHARSQRRDQAFIAINCATLPEHLVESLLFGHRKGSFTDATEDHMGYFVSADGGTLFLDEIAELSLQAQVKILRVLQEHQVTAVGTHQAQDINIRLICATHVNLEQAIQQKKFRQDLYYRINTIELRIPPLRQRKEDILLLAEEFIQDYNKENETEYKPLTSAAKKLLLEYYWPGNVRELQSTMTTAILFSQSDKISAHDLKLHSRIPHHQLLPLEVAKEQFIHSYIQEALQLHSGNRQKTAEALKVSVRTIFRYLQRDKNSSNDHSET